jgi:bacillithiol biosynthesis cysteine-adding enzyme BshC
VLRLSEIPISKTTLVPPIVHDLLQQENLNFNSTADRKLLIAQLQLQYKALRRNALVDESIASLRDENTFTVTTGHQLCLFGGPAYFIYKIVSTISAARIYSQKYPDKNFVPVFWMASEDHDFEEVNHLYLFGKKMEWQRDAKGAVGRLSTAGLDALLEEIKVLTGDSELLTILRNAAKEKNLADFTRHFLHHLFGNQGLVVIDADDAALKKSFTAVIAREFKEKIGKVEVEKANAVLQEKYKLQVHPREINFFYLDENIRERFTENDGRNWEQLLLESPEKFSPNVIYRPLYQEYILPNVAYVGGPNELAYWFQLKGVFAAHHIAFPQLLLRDSFLVINSNQRKVMSSLNLCLEDLFLSAEQLKVQYMQGKSEIQDSPYFQEMERLFAQIKSAAIKVDGSLEGAVEAEKTKAFKQLEALMGRIKKAEKLRHEIALNKIDKLKAQLFPEGVFQERRVNFLEFYAKYGNAYFEALFLNANPLNTCLKVLEEE